jgi:hypothetical protein
MRKGTFVAIRSRLAQLRLSERWSASENKERRTGDGRCNARGLARQRFVNRLDNYRSGMNV